MVLAYVFIVSINCKKIIKYGAFFYLVGTNTKRLKCIILLIIVSIYVWFSLDSG